MASQDNQQWRVDMHNRSANNLLAKKTKFYFLIIAHVKVNFNVQYRLFPNNALRHETSLYSNKIVLFIKKRRTFEWGLVGDEDLLKLRWVN